MFRQPRTNQSTSSLWLETVKYCDARAHSHAFEKGRHLAGPFPFAAEVSGLRRAISSSFVSTEGQLFSIFRSGGLTVLLRASYAPLLALDAPVVHVNYPVGER